MKVRGESLYHPDTGKVSCTDCGIAHDVDWSDGELFILLTPVHGLLVGQRGGTEPMTTDKILTRLAMGLVAKCEEVRKLQKTLDDVENSLGLGELIDDVEHQIDYHADTLPAAYRTLAAALARIHAAVAATRPVFDDDRFAAKADKEFP